VLAEIGIELADECGVRLQQSAPCPLSAPARQRFVDKPVEARGCWTQPGIYLHVQQVSAKVLALASTCHREKDHLMIEVQTDLDSTLRRRFATPADDARVIRTAAALEANGITVLRARNSAEAKRIVLDLIPAGSQVHQGASQSLDAAGITDEIERSGRYQPLRPRVFSMDRATQADEIRRLSASPNIMLGSVHAVTETGSLVAASASGTQLGPYASGAGKVILLVGTQKIVPDLDDALRRIDQYAFLLEDARAQAAYGIHSGVNKVLIINREWTPERITVVLCDEPLGF
jgi:LUD domain